MTEFGRFDQQIPTSVDNPAISIERWDGSQLISIINEAPMISMSGSIIKYVYEWVIPTNAVLDTYLITYSATVDDMPARDADTIEVIRD